MENNIEVIRGDLQKEISKVLIYWRNRWKEEKSWVLDRQQKIILEQFLCKIHDGRNNEED